MNEQQRRSLARLLFLLEERAAHDKDRQCGCRRPIDPAITPAIRQAMDDVAKAYAQNNPAPARTPEEDGTSRFQWLETD